VLLGVIVIGAFRSREPEYGGKRLSEWVMAYADYTSPTSDSQQIDDAIRHIGTNAIPYLLDWIRYEPPQSETNRLARTIQRGFRLQDKGIRADFAVVALTRLRLQTNECIAELGRMMNDTNAVYGGLHAIQAWWFRRGGSPGFAGRLDERAGLLAAPYIKDIGSMGTNARVPFRLCSSS